MEETKNVSSELEHLCPIFLIRNLEAVKEWARNKTCRAERYELLANSEGERLRTEGTWVPSNVNHVGWLLSGKDNAGSSYYLEMAASEFKVQGSKVNYAVLAWDTDFRYTTEGFSYFKFSDTKWNRINQERRQRYLGNAYRVSLTRVGQGLIIYVPERSDGDPSRDRDYYDKALRYLKNTGMEEIRGVIS